MQQIDLVHRLVRLYKEYMGLVRRAADIMDLHAAGKFASLIGVEGLHQIGNSPSILRLYYELGVRYVTLAHNKNNLYADSAVGHHYCPRNYRFSLLTDLSDRHDFLARWTIYPGKGYDP